MQIETALLTRRTVHAYAPDPVPEEALLRALEAANHAPCHKLTWPWRFVWPGSVTRAQLAQVAVRLKGAKDDPERAARVRAKVLDPTELLVFVQRVAEDPFRAKEDYAALCCAIHAASLSLHAEGLGSKWSTGALTRDEESRRLLGLEEGDEVVGFLWIGHPAKVPSPPERPAVGERLTRLG